MTQTAAANKHNGDVWTKPSAAELELAPKWIKSKPRAYGQDVIDSLTAALRAQKVTGKSQETIAHDLGIPPGSMSTLIRKYIVGMPYQPHLKKARLVSLASTPTDPEQADDDDYEPTPGQRRKPSMPYIPHVNEHGRKLEDSYGLYKPKNQPKEAKTNDYGTTRSLVERSERATAADACRQVRQGQD